MSGSWAEVSQCRVVARAASGFGSAEISHIELSVAKITLRWYRSLSSISNEVCVTIAQCLVVGCIGLLKSQSETETPAAVRMLLAFYAVWTVWNQSLQVFLSWLDFILLAICSEDLCKSQTP